MTALFFPIAVILAGLTWSIAWALFPSRDATGGCGTPVVDAFSATHDPFAVSCQHEGLVHVAVGIIVGALIVWGGLMLLLEALTVGSLHHLAPHRGADPSAAGPSRRSSG